MSVDESVLLVAVNKINLRFGGPAGTGIMNMGMMFSKACSRIGLHVFDYPEYPSLIRGGHNTYLVRAEDEPVRSHIRLVDVLIAFDEATLTLHADELKEDSLVVYDDATVKPERTRLKQGIRCPLPLQRLVTEMGGTEVMANTTALAAVLGILDYDFDTFAGIIRDQFKDKPAVAELNVKVARHGYDYAQQQYEKLSHYRFTKVAAPKRMVITGNEALALGAVKAGMKFYAAYPMTPSSAILHTLAAWQERHDFIVKHAEDEISVINMAVGAGYAGVRAAVGTSGGGFALMNEAFSLAGMSETPVVIFEVQRPGPATGMPTWTEQGDLQYALHAGHGEFPRFVLAPGDVDECFWLTIEAFNLAERYQTPVIVLTDKYVAESHRTTELFDQQKVRIDRGKLLRQAPPNYLRYAVTPDGVSPRVLPGTPGGLHLCNSYEHDEFGWTTEEAEPRKRMVEKRARKEDAYRKEQPQPLILGPAKAELTIVSWGGNKGPILDAMTFLQREGITVNYLHLTHLSPFPGPRVADLLQAAKRTLLIENNSTAQLGQLIRAETGIALKDRFLRYDGRPHSPEEIHDKVKASLRGGA